MATRFRCYRAVAARSPDRCRRCGSLKQGSRAALAGSRDHSPTGSGAAKVASRAKIRPYCSASVRRPPRLFVGLASPARGPPVRPGLTSPATRSGVPTPRRRTLAAVILPSARSMPAALSASCLRLPPTPALGAWEPPPGNAFHERHERNERHDLHERHERHEKACARKPGLKQRSPCYTSQTAKASRRPASGSRVGMNSWPT